MIGAGSFLSPSEKDQTKINNAIRQLMEGRTNNVFSVTLNSNTTSTTITSVLIGPNSTLSPVPLTANAAAQMTLLRVASLVAQTAILAHGSNANSDQSFSFIVTG